MKLRLSLVTLGVADIARARAFYDALGLIPGPSSNDHVVFYDMDGVILALYGNEALAQDAGLASLGAGGAKTLAWNLSSPGEVDDAIELALSAGAELVKSAAATFWGGYSGYFADPDGHLWEVAHNPFFPFDDRGAVRLPGA